MPKDQLLSSFLIKASQLYLQNDIAVAQKEILRSICSDLSAVYCAVYLKKDAAYVPFLDYSPAESASFSLQLKNLELRTVPTLVKDRQNVQRLFPESMIQEYLYLPLRQGKRLPGFLLVLWDKPGILDQSSEAELDLLLPLSLIFENIYWEPAYIQAQTEQTDQIETRNLADHRELDERLNTTSLALHDEIDRMLQAIIFQLEAVQGLDDMDILMGRLAGLQFIAEQCLEKVQQVCTNINPDLISRTGLKAALTAQVQDYQASPNMEVELSINGDLQEVSPLVETIVYQATRQSLAYLQQHLYHGKLDVRLTVKQRCIFLQMTGHDQSMMQDILEQNLAELHKQVNLVSGKLWINSLDALGPSINLLLPLD
jgi:signal transduction histidine kinase